VKGKKKRRKKIKKKNHSNYYKSLTYSEQKEYLEDREYLKYVRLQLTIFVFISIVTAIFGLLIFFLAYFSMDAEQ
jgi:Mg2+/citrate symporter